MSTSDVNSYVSLKIWFDILKKYTPKCWGDLSDEKYAETMMLSAYKEYNNILSKLYIQ
jgi:hypothetical protein